MMIPRFPHTQCSRVLAAHTPAIITGALDDWHCASCWTPDAIVQHCPQRPVVVSRSPTMQFNYSDATAMASQQSGIYTQTTMGFADAVEAVLAAGETEHLYIMQQSVETVCPELLDHIAIPQWLAAEDPAIHFWIGKQTTTPLHFDFTENLFAQVHGSKRFILFSPQDTDSLYPFSLAAAMPHLSHVDASAPDLTRFPAFAKAMALEADLQAGDVLYLPPFWWHQVIAPAFSISVNFWCKPSLAAIFAAPNAERALINFYRDDQLKGLQSFYLQPQGMGLLDLAHLLLLQQRLWAATLLLCAAFEESARAAFGSVQSVQGANLADLPQRMTAISQQFFATALLTPALQRQLLLFPQCAQAVVTPDGRTRLTMAMAQTGLAVMAQVQEAVCAMAAAES